MALLNAGIGAYAGPGASGWTSGASAMAANPSPQGPVTIGQQAFGVVGGGGAGGANTSAYAILGGGALALGVLVFIWWSLPR